MTLFTTIITLLLVMDPLGNIPIFLSILNTVEAKKHSRIILRETFIAFIILTIFLFSGKHILNSLHINQSALGVSGGIILFLISIKMIFPGEGGSSFQERQIGEPFIVPLAIPLIAGPSTLATVLLFANQAHNQLGLLFVALLIASCICAILLLFANQLRRLLGQKGLIAMERLMGMILITVSVQMFLDGLQNYFRLIPNSSLH